jgi:photosystem II stability/assembly factor-like uncharacterized protein
MYVIAKILLVVLVLAAAPAVKAEWVRERTNTLAWLHDITFSSPSNGWIVGSDGTVLKTADGGMSWSQAKKFSSDNLLQAHFTDDQNGWILCERNIYSRGPKASSYLLRTINGGKDWEQVEFGDAGRERITHMVFDKNGSATAVGERGVMYRLQADGKTWKRVPAPIGYLLLSGSYSGDGTGALAGTSGTIMFTVDDGLGWDKATVIGDTSARINSVFFISQRLGWAVGSGGAVLASTGGGRVWRHMDSGTRTDLNDVFFVDDQEGWAVGDSGTILHTMNGGRSWAKSDSPVKHRLERVYFKGKRGWAVGFGGTLISNDAASEAINTNGKT